MRTDKFVERHVGPNEEELKKMLAKINADSIDDLLDTSKDYNYKHKKHKKTIEI